MHLSAPCFGFLTHCFTVWINSHNSHQICFYQQQAAEGVRYLVSTKNRKLLSAIYVSVFGEHSREFLAAVKAKRMKTEIKEKLFARWQKAQLQMNANVALYLLQYMFK